MFMYYLFELLKEYFLIFLGFENEFENISLNHDQEEKTKFINRKVLSLLLTLILIICIFYLFYQVSFNTNSIEYLLKELKSNVDIETFQKIEKIIFKIIKNPEEKQTGLYLLEIIKICKGIDSKTEILDLNKFNFYLDKIIEFLSK